MTKTELHEIVDLAFDELIRQVSERVSSKEKLSATWLKEARQTLLAAKDIARDMPHEPPKEGSTMPKGVKHANVPFPFPSRDGLPPAGS